MMNINLKKSSKADLLKYKALHRIISQDKVTIYYDYEKLNKTGSPVYNPWENLLPILFPLFIGFGLVFFVGIFIALMVITASCLLYVHYLRKFIYMKLKDRAREYMLASIEKFQELWNLKSLTLVTKDDKNMGCFSPDGDWRDFIVKYYSEYMVDDKIEEDVKEEKVNRINKNKTETRSVRKPREKRVRNRRNEQRT